MSRSLRVLVSVAALVLVGGGEPAAMARPSGPGMSAKLTAIVVRGIDRLGKTRQLKGYFHPTAVRFFRDGFEQLIYPDSNGVLHVRPGTYLIGVDIPTFGPGDTQVSDTLAARFVRVRTSGGTRTVTVDARPGVPVQVSFSPAWGAP